MRKQADHWNLTYVSWQDFSHAILAMEGDLWTQMVKGDLVIGGMDFHSDFL